MHGPTRVFWADLTPFSLQGIVGEVCIRGENVAAGYHNRPDANESEYRFGWFHTGSSPSSPTLNTVRRAVC